MECEALPEGCIAKILSHTTPSDACRLSLVSRTFYSAAQSDTVWDHFLPSDIISIISRSDSESSLLADSPSKKSLYLALSHQPILIDHATKPSPGGAYGFIHQSVDVSIAVAGGESHRRSMFLDEERRQRLGYQIIPRGSGFLIGRSRSVPIVQHSDDDLDNQYPKQIGNGWFEVELGEFFNKGEDKEVEMGVYEIKGGDWKRGLIVQGIEIRPKVPYA